MHPKEDNLRLVSLPSNAPKPTLSSPSTTLAALEGFLEAGVPLVSTDAPAGATRLARLSRGGCPPRRAADPPTTCTRT